MLTRAKRKAAKRVEQARRAKQAKRKAAKRVEQARRARAKRPKTPWRKLEQALIDRDWDVVERLLEGAWISPTWLRLMRQVNWNFEKGKERLWAAFDRNNVSGRTRAAKESFETDLERGGLLMDALRKAVDENNLSLAQKLLAKGVGSEYVVYVAAQKGYAQMLRLLMGFPMQPFKMTPLEVACINGHEKCVEILKDSPGDGLHYAIRGMRKHLFHLFKPASHHMCYAARVGYGVEELLRLGGDKNAVWRDLSAMEWAVANNHVMVVKLLLENGAKFHAALRLVCRKDKTGLFRLFRQVPVDIAHSAAYFDAAGILSMLPLAENRVRGLLPIDIAAQRGNLRSVKALLRLGAAKGTAVYRAIKYGHADVVRALGTVERFNDKTPVMWALQHRQLECLLATLPFNPEPYLTYQAAHSGYAECLRLLKDRGELRHAPVRAVGTRWSPVYVAAFQGHLEAVEVLLAGGASLKKAALGALDGKKWDLYFELDIWSDYMVQFCVECQCLTALKRYEKSFASVHKGNWWKHGMMRDARVKWKQRLLFADLVLLSLPRGVRFVVKTFLRGTMDRDWQAYLARVL